MNNSHDVVVLKEGASISTGDVELVARGRARVELSQGVPPALERCRELLLQAMSRDEPIYGVNTGFGALGRVRISSEELEALQVNLVRSHSTGVGQPLPPEIVRATMFVLLASLCRGFSGVRSVVVDTIRQMLNAGITPMVPEVGSVGASGDLAPLAHIALVLIGEGSADFHGAMLPGGEAMDRAGVKPVTLSAKEGIALINGTHLMTGRAALIVRDFHGLFEAALVAAAMSVDACRATDSTLDPRVHEVRHQPGQIEVARRLRELLSGSEIIPSHAENDPRVQDPYSFRCCPAVLGSVWDLLAYVEQCVSTELQGVTDNPLVFSEAGQGRVVSGGNFHGMPVALPLDCLAIGIAHLAGISERRIYHMLSGSDPAAELPTFLTPQAGLQSGLMITQYTAAACCNELIGLAFPASAVNLPTSAGMEDYNSFGPRSAAKAERCIQLARSIVAIEFMCAATGLDYHRPLRSGREVEKAYQRIREHVPPLHHDRSPAPDIFAIERLIADGRFGP